MASFVNWLEMALVVVHSGLLMCKQLPTYQWTGGGRVGWGRGPDRRAVRQK